MLRKAPFSFAQLHQHMRPTLAHAYPVLGVLPDAMRDMLDQLDAAETMTLSERLQGIKRLCDDEVVLVS